MAVEHVAGTPEKRPWATLQFRVLGFAVEVHPSFWIVPVVIATGRPSAVSAASWIAVTIVSVLLHELGHAIVFAYYQVPAKIELKGLGGQTEPLVRPNWSRKQFAVMYLAGPIPVLLFGFLQLILWRHLHTDRWSAVAQQLYNDFTTVNIVWSLYNLLPILPLDGGQLVRVALDNRSRYSKIAPWLVSLGVGVGVSVAGSLLQWGQARYLTAMLVFVNVAWLWWAAKNKFVPQLEVIEDLNREGKFEQAVALAKQIEPEIQRPHEKNRALSALAWAQMKTNQSLEAAQTLQKFSNEHDAPLEILTTIDVRTGNSQRAVERLQEQIDLQQDVASCQQQLLWVYVSSGELDRGLALLNDALSATRTIHTRLRSLETQLKSLGRHMDAQRVDEWICTHPAGP